ncbi:hypothetical protein SAMN04488008_102472 [Maribacter orientalis]|uniref:Uncharacterized protein n=1 Tax=Maribacter orientalis TaxID=228957 RepID=A0A1H7L687_9FLAO|nr:hypothetical protein SAMN04488008_102472 [Maribacter orientalis]
MFSIERGIDIVILLKKHMRSRNKKAYSMKCAKSKISVLFDHIEIRSSEDSFGKTSVLRTFSKIKAPISLMG